MKIGIVGGVQSDWCPPAASLASGMSAAQKASACNADAGLIDACMTQKNFFKSSLAYKPAT